MIVFLYLQTYAKEDKAKREKSMEADNGTSVTEDKAHND